MGLCCYKEIEHFLIWWFRGLIRNWLAVVIFLVLLYLPPIRTSKSSIVCKYSDEELFWDEVNKSRHSFSSNPMFTFCSSLFDSSLYGSNLCSPSVRVRLPVFTVYSVSVWYDQLNLVTKERWQTSLLIW